MARVKTRRRHALGPLQALVLAAGFWLVFHFLTLAVAASTSMPSIGAGH